MPLRTAHTEATLAEFMARRLGPTLLDHLELNEAWLIDRVSDVLRDYGAADVADATDIPKLEALAEAEAWAEALNAATVWYAVSLDGTAMQRQQLYDHVRERHAAAVQRAGAYGGAGAVVVTDIIRPDPYSYQDDDTLAAFV